MKTYKIISIEKLSANKYWVKYITELEEKKVKTQYEKCDRVRLNKIINSLIMIQGDI
ncbi:hypothetical protein [Clostridium perfringens]|uniref:hypothetical protein n=1 Tax=Clostridium perfringens TaxID=1502 RepID=UPI00158923F3|nr:hypothetical protein [Clostridium perfringens]